MNHRFTVKIVIGMLLGVIAGLLLRWLPLSTEMRDVIINDVLQTGGKIFINIIKMLVVPIVFVSLVCGTSSLGDIKKFGRIGGKTLILYLLTTALAISIALIIATLLHIGEGANLKTTDVFTQQAVPSLKDVIISMFPANPIAALAQGFMLQIIVFSVLLGLAMTACGDAGKRIAAVFNDINEVLMRLIGMIMQTAPYGVFCLLAVLFAKMGFNLIGHLMGYFFTVLLVLMVQLFVVYTTFLKVFGRLSPVIFFKKMYSAMLFAFSVSSSNASIPVVLRTVEERLGVKNSVASFVIPLGSTINMDGTAIMQGVATAFIAHAFGIPIGITGYLTVVFMATLASVGTAGVPGVGLITLAMVLEQVGLPVAGIALIIGVDRLLDMVRTAVNIAGDAMVSCVVGKSENAMELDTYRDVASQN